MRAVCAPRAGHVAASREAAGAMERQRPWLVTSEADATFPGLRQCLTLGAHAVGVLPARLWWGREMECMEGPFSR